jgi:hypothetical protein
MAGRMGPLIGGHRTVGSPGRHASAEADFDPKRRFATVNYCIAKGSFALDVAASEKADADREIWNICPVVVGSVRLDACELDHFAPFSTSSEKSFPKLAGKYREAQVGNRAFSLSAATRSRAAPVAGKCGIAASERLRRRNKLWKLPRWARNCIGFLTSFASSSCRGLRGMLN